MNNDDVRATLEAILLSEPKVHVFAHVSDDRIFEFLACSHATRAGDGLIDLVLIGSAGEGQDPDIFRNITRQLLIEILPLDVEPRLARNLPLRNSRIEAGTFEGGSLRLSTRIFDAASPRAIDAPAPPLSLGEQRDALARLLTEALDELFEVTRDAARQRSETEAVRKSIKERANAIVHA